MIKHLGLVVVLGLTTGCGTIFGLGGDREIQVTSEPAGATIYVDSQAHDAAVSPCPIDVDPAMNHVIEARLKRDGKELKGQTTLTREVRTSIIVLDAVLTLGFGLLVDWATGAMYRFDKDIVRINLGTSPDPAPGPFPRPEPRPELEPCSVCGEPRGDARTCPYCGIE